MPANPFPPFLCKSTHSSGRFLRHLALAATLMAPLAGRAQSVGIGNSNPDASAVLDVASTTKGLLVPRLTQATRLAMGTASNPAPAKGLLVFQTDGPQPGFWYNAGTPAAPAWTYLNPTAAGDDLGNHTATQNLSLAGNALTGTGASLGNEVGVGVRADGGLNIGQNTVGNNLFLGFQAGQAATGSSNVFSGYQAGQATSTGSSNVFSGYQSGYGNTTGSNNVFSGYKTGYSNQSGGGNIFSGYKVGYANTTGSGNLFSGHFAGYSNLDGNNNVFLGGGSGYRNTAGLGNVFVGTDCGNANTTGSYNVFSGYACGQGANSGDFNVFSGYVSGFKNTTGGSNIFSGYASGYSNTAGSNNVFMGSSSGYSNTLGTNNVFSGYYAGRDNTEGSDNVFSGHSGGSQNSTGSFNAFFGAGSGSQNTTGSNNTALGAHSDFSAVGLTNATVIGYNASVNTSNKVRLGNASVTVIEGQVAYSYPSDARFKYQVRANVPGLAFITRLRPVTYRFDGAKLDTFQRTGQLPQGFTPDSAAAVQTGFLAQDVERAARALGYRFDGVHAPATARDHYSLAYSQFVMPLVQAVQEQQAQIEALQAQNAALQTQVADDHASLLTMQAQLARLLGEGAQAHK